MQNINNKHLKYGHGDKGKLVISLEVVDKLEYYSSPSRLKTNDFDGYIRKFPDSY